MSNSLFQVLYPSHINDILPPDIEAECRDDVMKLRVAFNDTFAGLIYSAGIVWCVYQLVEYIYTE